MGNAGAYFGLSRLATNALLVAVYLIYGAHLSHGENILQNAVIHDDGIILKMHVKVPVIILGSQKEGELSIDANKLSSALYDSFPYRTVDLLDESWQPLKRTRGTTAAVEYKLDYEVLRLPSPTLMKYEDRLAELLKKAQEEQQLASIAAEADAEIEPLRIDATEFEDFFERIVGENGFLEGHELRPGVNAAPPLVLLAPDQGRLAQRLGATAATPLRYRYHLGPGPGSQCAGAWVTAAGPAALDLTGGACPYELDFEAFPISVREAALARTSPVPKLTDAVLDGGFLEALNDDGGSTPLLSSNLASTPIIVNAVISALKNLLLPDLPVWPHDTRPRVICPILLLSGDVLASEDAATDVADPQRTALALRELAPPGQETVALLAQHTLHDHPQVATALLRARRTRRLYRTLLVEEEQAGPGGAPAGGVGREAWAEEEFLVEEEYFDGPALLEALRDAGGDLVGAALGETGAPLLHLELEVELGEAWAEVATQVVPVFVFRVSEYFGGRFDGRSFFADGSPVYATPRAVLVLQDATRPDATPAVVAGLAAAVYGLSPPHLARARPPEGPPPRAAAPGGNGGGGGGGAGGWAASDLLWAKGRHPFPPFGALPARGEAGGAAAFSGAFRVAAARNVVAGRLLFCLMAADDIADLLEELADEYLPAPVLSGQAAGGGGGGRPGASRGGARRRLARSAWEREWLGEALALLGPSAPARLAETLRQVHGHLQTLLKDFNDVYRFASGGSLEHAVDLSFAVLSEGRALFREAQRLLAEGRAAGLACARRAYPRRAAGAGGLGAWVGRHLPRLAGALALAAAALWRLAAGARRRRRRGRRAGKLA